MCARRAFSLAPEKRSNVRFVIAPSMFFKQKSDDLYDDLYSKLNDAINSSLPSHSAQVKDTRCLCVNEISFLFTTSQMFHR